jgi:hypothetical protein
VFIQGLLSGCASISSAWWGHSVRAYFGLGIYLDEFMLIV